MDGYLAVERNRQRHAVECQELLGLRPFGRRAAAELLAALLPQAIEDDRFASLAGVVMQTCRQRGILVPSPVGLERLCADLRHQAHREVQHRLTNGLSAQQRQRLDALTQRRAETGQSWLTWLRQMPEAAKPVAMLGLIERLDHVRAIGIEPGRGHLIHQARLGQLARQAGRTSVQHVAGYERQRRHATLVATTLDISASLTDQALDLFDRLIGAMFRKAEGRHARAFQADARAINEKVRLYARVGAALITAQAAKQDAFGAITAVIPWERFRTTVAEAEALARPEEFGVYQKLSEHYAGVRRWSPAFLRTFEFASVPASASLLRGIEVLREANLTGVSVLPKSTPTGFVRQRWAPYVLPGGIIDRSHYELCVLSELRDRLRAGDVWVGGSRQYRSFEERLISKQTLQDLQQAGTLPIAVEADFERFIEGRRTLLNKRLMAIDASAKDDLLPYVTIDRGVLKIAPIEKSTPAEAEALAARLYAMLPRIRITDLMAEVAAWTQFPDCSLICAPAKPRPTTARSWPGCSPTGSILASHAWPRRAALPASASSPGHRTGIREETYALALRRLVDQQQREPFAAMFGSANASSSDGQFFRHQASAATPAASMPITVSSRGSRSTRTDRTATARSSPS